MSPSPGSTPSSSSAASSGFARREGRPGGLDQGVRVGSWRLVRSHRFRHRPLKDQCQQQNQ